MPTVVELQRNPEEPDHDENMALRRLAVLVTAKLPDNPADAIKVLDLSRRLVLEFIKA